MVRTFAVFIQSVIDIILPRKERVMRLDSYTVDDILVEPISHEACDVEITTLMHYRTRAVEDLVKALKYDRAGYAAGLLADVLAEYLREEIAQLQAFSTKKVLLIPVPLHASRRRERGFNQIEKVLAALPEEFKNGTLASIDAKSLVRTRATPQQTRLSREERLRNVGGAFALAKPLENVHVILIDDVTTTGATLSEAARPLGNIDRTLIALAHA